MKRIILSLCIGLGVFASFLFVYSVVSHFHSRFMPNLGIALIVMLGLWTPIHWGVVFKLSTDARNKKLDALDEKLNHLLEQQAR